MKKSRLFAGCMAVVALTLALASCTMPDYQLSTDVTVSAVYSDSLFQYVDIHYTLTNIGTKNLKNVQVYVTVTPYNVSSAGPTTASQELGPYIINAGDYKSDTKMMIHVGAPGAYSWATVKIDSVGWDDAGNTTWF